MGVGAPEDWLSEMQKEAEDFLVLVAKFMMENKKDLEWADKMKVVQKSLMERDAAAGVEIEGEEKEPVVGQISPMKQAEDGDQGESTSNESEEELREILASQCSGEILEMKQKEAYRRCREINMKADRLLQRLTQELKQVAKSIRLEDGFDPRVTRVIGAKGWLQGLSSEIKKLRGLVEQNLRDHEKCE